MTTLCDITASSHDEMGNNPSIVKELIFDLTQAINEFFRLFDVEAFEKVIELVMACPGIVFFTGVGKSGIVAKKAAATMSSSGTKALYISSQNALHGDIGVVSKGDIVFLLSKSGETQELIELCPALRNKGAILVAVVANGSQSRLSKASDHTFILPQLKELCPFDLAPTTSTLSQLIFSDLLSMALMRKKGITKEDFIKNHPAGRIGKRHLIRVKDLMVTGDAIPQCCSEDLLADVLVELSNKKCGCVCIVDEESRLVGIFTDGDLRRAIQKNQEKVLSLPLSEIMTVGPRVVLPEELAYNAMLLMEEDQKRPITVLPVTNSEGKLVGLIKMHDILQSGL